MQCSSQGSCPVPLPVSNRGRVTTLTHPLLGPSFSLCWRWWWWCKAISEGQHGDGMFYSSPCKMSLSTDNATNFVTYWSPAPKLWVKVKTLLICQICLTFVTYLSHGCHIFHLFVTFVSYLSHGCHICHICHQPVYRLSHVSVEWLSDVF